MNDSRASIQVLDRGGYMELRIGPGRLAESAYGQLAAHGRAAKPVLLVWEVACEDLGFMETFRMGVALADMNGPVAIVFREPDAMVAARFTQLVAQNRGARIRTCDDVRSAKAWLGVD